VPVRSPQATKKDVPQTLLAKKDSPPPPPANKEVPPPPPPIHDLLPQPAPSNEELRLNIYVLGMMGKMNMSILVVEKCKIPSVRREVWKTLKVQDEAGYLPIILNTMYHGRQGEDNPPFYLSLGINGFCLNSCMLDSGASTNMISLKVMKQLGFHTTRPCGIIVREYSSRFVLAFHFLFEYINLKLLALLR
jgi:hypothetical protein